MAINKNHEVQELNGIKCAIVEKNVNKNRTAFLKKLLEFNHYVVVVEQNKAIPNELNPMPSNNSLNNTFDDVVLDSDTYSVGVTDYTFNRINAIFGRMLNTPDGHVATLAFWNQWENGSHDEIPYYENPQHT